jgi:putative transposase
MSYNPQLPKPNRQSIRLKGYDYTKVGLYFITICCQNRSWFFGSDVLRENDDGMDAHVSDGNDGGNDGGNGGGNDDGNDDGNGAHVGAPRRGGPISDEPLLNPHIKKNNHPKIILNNAGKMVEYWYWELEKKYPDKRCHQMVVMPNHVHFIIENNKINNAAIGDVVGWFKTMITNEYIRGVKNLGWPPFKGKLWQRNYYENIIRDENSYLRIAKYIENNPVKWCQDKFYCK